ncbi:MAG: sulfurtransferase TusA family protein [Desulfobacterales bacterium]
MKEIDARGLSCPAPVLQTKAVVEQEKADAVRVVVTPPHPSRMSNGFSSHRDLKPLWKNRAAIMSSSGSAPLRGKKKKPRSLSLRATSN